MTLEEIEAACIAGKAPARVPDDIDIGELPFRATFFPMGFPLEVRTNAEEVLEIHGRMWKDHSLYYDAPPMISDVYVAEGGGDDCPPMSFYHYLRPFFTAVADREHHALIDKERRRSWISITRASLRHQMYLEYFFFMLPLTTLPADGIHAACVAQNGRGILLCGDSGAGKSTLAYACARTGWEYLCDDVTLLTDGPQRLVTGNCHLVRFRPSAVDLFPEIRGLSLTPRAGGKPSIELSTHPMSHIKRCRQTRIDFIVFLNRRSSRPAQILPFRKDVARLYLCHGIFATDEAERRHAESIDGLLEAPVLELHYNKLNDAIDQLNKLVQQGCHVGGC